MDSIATEQMKIIKQFIYRGLQWKYQLGRLQQRGWISLLQLSKVT